MTKHGARLARFVCLCAALAVMGGCGREEARPQGEVAPPPSFIGSGQPLLPQVDMAVGGVSVRAEIARTPHEQQQGLSRRERLEEGIGMLFIYTQPVTPSFWMKEMRFPLDMIWIRGGEVVDVSAQVPHPDPSLPLERLPFYTPREPVDQVLEVAAGWAAEHGVAIGSAVYMRIVDP